MLFRLALVLFGLLVIPAAMSAGAGELRPYGPESRIEINIPEFALRVYQGGAVVRTFPVGVGRPGFPTPVGEYKVINRMENPTWENPYLKEGAVRIKAGTDNPLGTRWLGFYNDGRGEYGIHGTDNPSSVGKASSHGCIRMKIKDAESVFSLVEMGAPVSTTYRLYQLEQKGSTVVLKSFPDLYRRGKPDVRQVERQARVQFPQAALMPEAMKFAVENPSSQGRVVGFLSRYRAAQSSGFIR